MGIAPLSLKNRPPSLEAAMLKVFLVEDEIIVREGIKKNIDWAGHGYEFAGEASDGELAWPMIEKTRPDIVITDIKMPFMDGLELSRLIKKELPATEIMILTGFADFEYAKEGIQIGVAEYLMKPISGAELLSAVDALAVKIEKKRESERLRAFYEKEMAEKQLLERKEFFTRLVSGGHSMKELMDMADRLGISISAVWYNIILFRLQSPAHEADEYSRSLANIEEQLENALADGGSLLFDRDLEGQALIVTAGSEEELAERTDRCIETIKTVIREYPHVRYFGGIGQPVGRIRELSTSYDKAAAAFACRYLLPDNQFIRYDQTLPQGISERIDEPSLSAMDVTRFDRSRVEAFLKTGDVSETRYFVTEYFRSTGTAMMQSALLRQYITMDAYFCSVRFLEELGLKEEEKNLPAIGYQEMESEKAATDYIQRVFEQVLSIRDRAADDRYRDVVEKAISYIDEHFDDPELSLNALAAYVNLSPNHLSMIFSQKTGSSFIRYLTDCRMARAKELLRCTSKRSSEISEEVGYRDPHYFSFLFKKTQGMTPTQYRNRE